MELPWARIEQIVELIIEQTKEEDYKTLERAAFIGWQFHINTPRERHAYRDLKQWIRDMGIRRPGEVYSDEIKLEKERALDNYEKVLNLFNAGNIEEGDFK